MIFTFTVVAFIGQFRLFNWDKWKLNFKKTYSMKILFIVQKIGINGRRRMITS